MKLSFSEISNALSAKMRGKYPCFPLHIDTSLDDSNIIRLRVFSVPSDMVSEVKSFVRQIREEILCGSQQLVLPMIKTLETTRQYYPEYLQKSDIANNAPLIWTWARLRRPSDKWQVAANLHDMGKNTEGRGLFSHAARNYITTATRLKPMVEFGTVNKGLADDVENRELQLAA